MRKRLKAAALTPEVLEDPLLDQLSESARRGLDDLWYFLTYYVGLDLEELPHREAVEAIQKALTHRAEKALIVIPRGFYKTSIAAGSLVWLQMRQVCLFKNYFYRIVTASATLALGELTLRRIATILEYGGKHNRMLHDYPRLWQERKWGGPGSSQEDGIYLRQRLKQGGDPTRPEPNFWVGSLKRISTGFHADAAFLDDLNNKENVQTPFQRQKVKEYFELICPILVQQDAFGNPPPLVYTCTPWHDDDVRGQIEREEEARRQKNPEAKHRWEIVHFGAFLEDGSPRFPTKYPLSALEKLREDMTTERWSANYLCDPVGDAFFVKEEWIQFKPRESFPPLMQIRIASDPNQHKEAKVAGCYATVGVVGFDRFAKAYLLEAHGSRTWSSMEYLNLLFELRERYPNARLLIEDAHMAHFEHAVRLEESRRSEAAGQPVRLRISWVSVPTDRSKYDRYDKLEPRFRSRSFIFADDIPLDTKLELKDELVRGPKARFQDFLDMLAIADTGVRPRYDSTGAPAEAPTPKDSPAEPRVPTIAEIYGGRLPYQ